MQLASNSGAPTEHHEGSVGHHGWRRLWRVGRVGLVVTAVVVVGVNLVRCLSVREAGASTTTPQAGALPDGKLSETPKEASADHKAPKESHNRAALQDDQPPR